MVHSSKHSRAGFSLIELALAALLVGVGLMALIALGRNAARAAMEAEDELRAAALAEDLFAALRAASSEVFQTRGHDACVAFWEAVTNANQQAVGDFLITAEVPLLPHPAAAANGYIVNDAMRGETFTFPFLENFNQNMDSGHAFRPANDNMGTFWDARYTIHVKLMNLWSTNLPPNVAHVGVNIRPRTTNVTTSSMNARENMSFYTSIPLEPMRQTLFTEAR